VGHDKEVNIEICTPLLVFSSFKLSYLQLNLNLKLNLNLCRYLALMVKYNGCSSVMRRPSVHEKDAMSAKDARDEGLHVLEMMAAVSQNDDDDDDNGESMHANHVEVG